MTIKHSFTTAFWGLKMQKSRSLLTILGIVIGITSIILIMSLGKGAQNLILSQIQSIGPKTIAIVPGREPKGPSDIIGTLTNSLRQKDVDALQKKENVPHLAKIMPIVFGSETAAFENETYRPTIFGVTNFFADIYDMRPDQGRLFQEEEIKGAASAVIIGSKVKEELFGQNEALEEKIKIKGRNFKVIGILPGKGQFSFLNFDEAVVIPYTTAQQYVFGIKYFHRLVIEADEEANVEKTVQDIKNTLRNSHDIADSSKDDFFVETQAEALETVSVIANILTLFLGAVAAISLLVGGIGIMNIMLVSVTERTKEIGLRKAIGATEKDIMVQFLLEAVILTAFGGVIGIILGAGFSFLASLIISAALSVEWVFELPLLAVILGLGVSAFVGLTFGIYPARQASLKSPIESLRYE